MGYTPRKIPVTVCKKAGSKIPLRRGIIYAVQSYLGVPVDRIRVNPLKDTWYDISNFDIMQERDSQPPDIKHVAKWLRYKAQQEALEQSSKSNKVIDNGTSPIQAPIAEQAKKEVVDNHALTVIHSIREACYRIVCADEGAEEKLTDEQRSLLWKLERETTDYLNKYNETQTPTPLI